MDVGIEVGVGLSFCSIYIFHQGLGEDGFVGKRGSYAYEESSHGGSDEVRDVAPR